MVKVTRLRYRPAIEAIKKMGLSGSHRKRTKHNIYTLIVREIRRKCQ